MGTFPACGDGGVCPNDSCVCLGGSVCVPIDKNQDPDICGCWPGESCGQDGGRDGGQDGGRDAGRDAGTDAGTGPAVVELCNDDQVCDLIFETCATCPSDCGACDDFFLNSEIRYVDSICDFGGDGTVDECVGDNGDTAGRYNDLQQALDEAGSGFKLVLHGGNYFQTDADQYSGAGVFVLENKSSMLARPIIIVASDRNNPPVLYSCDPDTDLVFTMRMVSLAKLGPMSRA